MKPHKFVPETSLKQFNYWNKPLQSLTNGLHLSSKKQQTNFGSRQQLVNCIPSPQEQLMVGSNEKDVESLFQFSLGPAVDLHLLQSFYSYLPALR